MYFRKAASPSARSAIAPEKVLDLGQLRRMTFDLVEIETLDMPDLVDDLDERSRDQALGEPGR